MYKVLIFDFDGTLCNTLPATQHAMRAAFLEVLQEAPSDQAIAEVVSLGLSLEKSILSLCHHFPTSNPETIAELVTQYREHYKNSEAQHCVLYHGCKALLEFARSRAAQVVILSNKGQAAVERAVAQFDIARHIDLILADSPDLARKPNPEAFTKLIFPHFKNYALSDFLMVGDTLADITFAQNARIDSCWAAYGYGVAKICRAANPTFRINSLNELIALLELEKQSSF